MKIPAFVFLILSIIVWSLSPLLVSTFADITHPFFSAAIAIWLSTLIAILASFKYRSVWRDARILFSNWNDNKTTFFYLSISAVLGYVLYPIFYFYGIQKGIPVISNLINYTWPVLGIIAGQRLSKRPISIESLIGLTLGFCGAGIILRTAIYSSNDASTIARTTSIEQLIPYAIAAGGAMAYGLYSSISKEKIVINIDDSKLLFILMLIVASACMLVIVLVFIGVGVNLQLSLKPNAVLAFLVYSIGLTLAHFSWLNAIRNLPSERSFVAVYLTPVFSTLLLTVAQSSIPSQIIIPGILFVLIGIYLSMHSERSINPLMATILSLFISWSATRILIPDKSILSVDNATLIINLEQLLLALFAIQSGFTLTNAIRRNAQIKQEFLNVVHDTVVMHRVANELKDSNIPLLANKFLYRLIEEIFSSETKSGIETLRMIDHMYLYINEKCEQPESKKVFVGLCDRVRVSSTSLNYLKHNGVSRYEWFILLILVIVMIFLAYIITDSGLIYMIVRSAIVGTLVLILFAIRDFDNIRPSKLRDFLIQAQSNNLILESNSLHYPYVTQYALKVADSNSSYNSRIKVITADDSGEMCNGEARQWETSIPSKLFLWTIVTVAIIVVYLNIAHR